jgi:hypothetical protein
MRKRCRSTLACDATVTDRRYKAAQGRIVAALYERRAHELRDARTSGGYRSLQRIMVFP